MHQDVSLCWLRSYQCYLCLCSQSTYTRCTHKFLLVFVVRKHIILKGNSFFVYTKYWSSDSTHFAHLSGKLWIPCQKNCFCFTAKHSLSHFSLLQNCWSAALQAYIPLMRRGQMPPGQRIIAGAKGGPIQAISRCLSLVFMCETGHCRVTKSLCHVFWPILVDFWSMHDSNW